MLLGDPVRNNFTPPPAPHLSWVWKQGISVLSKDDSYPIEAGKKGKLSRKTPPIIGGMERADPCVKLEWNGMNGMGNPSNGGGGRLSGGRFRR